MYEHKNLKPDETSSEPSGRDKRKSDRISAGNDYVAELIVSDCSMISNISKNGMCAVTPYMLEKDNMYNVKIHSRNSQMISLSALVVWSASMGNGEVTSSDRYETGLMFIELDQNRKNTLNKFIKNLSTA